MKILSYNCLCVICALELLRWQKEKDLLSDGWQWYQLVFPGFEEIMGVA